MNTSATDRSQQMNYGTNLKTDKINNTTSRKAINGQKIQQSKIKSKISKNKGKEIKDTLQHTNSI